MAPPYNRPPGSSPVDRRSTRGRFRGAGRVTAISTPAKRSVTRVTHCLRRDDRDHRAAAGEPHGGRRRQHLDGRRRNRHPPPRPRACAARRARRASRRVVSKRALLRRVWGPGENDEHVVEVTMARLRQRLGVAGCGIETVIRRGYRLNTVRGIANGPSRPSLIALLGHLDRRRPIRRAGDCAHDAPASARRHHRRHHHRHPRSAREAQRPGARRDARADRCAARDRGHRRARRGDRGQRAGVLGRPQLRRHGRGEPRRRPAPVRGVHRR